MALCQIVWVNKIYTCNQEELGHLLDGLIPLLFLFKSVFMNNQNFCFDYPTSGGNMLRMAGDLSLAIDEMYELRYVR